ncbi:hypothetical protein Pla110_07430 [Polystyrenella longa]|uniref:Uncharacterized protein n=1 Tax=Polystyrenella longa TaxID=2528007 RepID=A0A518CII5_9PLAN|nr:hypothetical protein [Polystyrenella longa]QDU79039.1 hypothetical protein Pla110_07430 [Polystyrenella longa]
MSLGMTSTYDENKNMELMTCPKCNAPLKEDDINKEMGAAQCTYCDTWIRLDEQGLHLQDPLREAPVDGLPIPDNIQFNRNSHELEIVVKSLLPIAKVAGVGSVMFIVVPLIFLGMITFFILSSPFPPVFAIIPVSMGLMALFTMRKVQKVFQHIGNDQVVKVEKHGDLYCQKPILGSEQPIIPVREIQQLYCTSIEKFRSRDSRRSRSHFMNSIFAVNALTRDNNSTVVISNLTKRNDAILIERHIEEFLGIPPGKVPGEIE